MLKKILANNVKNAAVDAYVNVEVAHLKQQISELGFQLCYTLPITVTQRAAQLNSPM